MTSRFFEPEEIGDDASRRLRGGASLLHSSAMDLSGQWLVLQSGNCGAAENMAWDEALLEASARLGQPVLRMYGWTESAATFGYSQKFAEAAAATHLRPLIRRPTGGGLVPHDADWTYSVIVPPSNEWTALSAVESYRRMHEWVRQAFTKPGVETELAACCKKPVPGQCFAGHEKYDVLWHGKKIAGAAQRRNRNGLLIQGSVQPPPWRLERVVWENAMCAVAGAQAKFSRWQPDDSLCRRVSDLAATKYSKSDYNQRR